MNKRERRNNRNRWRLLVDMLTERGWLPEKGTRMYYGEPQTPADKPDDILWETPKEDKTPLSKPCTTCQRCNYCGAHHEHAQSPVYVSQEVWAKIRMLMSRFKEHEWGGYFLADAEGVFTELIIPKQIGRPSTWEADPGEAEGLMIAGVIHSHIRMGVFHSGVDDDNLVANHPVSVVVSRKHDDSLEFEAIRSAKQECGALYRYKTTVLLALPDQTEWIEQAAAQVRVTTAGFLTERRPLPTPAGVTVYSYAGICDRHRWCYRDKNHTGGCSENREHYLCRKNSSQWCMLIDGHDGKCSNEGAPKGKKPAGLDQKSYIPGSVWSSTDHGAA